MSFLTCIIYYNLQTVRLKLMFVQVMCSEDNQKYTEYLVFISIREMSFKIVDITVVFCRISFCNQVIKSHRPVAWVAFMFWNSEPLLCSVLHTKKQSDSPPYHKR